MHCKRFYYRKWISVCACVNIVTVAHAPSSGREYHDQLYHNQSYSTVNSVYRSYYVVYILITLNIYFFYSLGLTCTWIKKTHLCPSLPIDRFISAAVVIKTAVWLFQEYGNTEDLFYACGIKLMWWKNKNLYQVSFRRGFWFWSHTVFLLHVLSCAY